MTPQEMQKRSGEKVRQVMDLAKMLHLTCEGRQRVNLQTGMIELMVFWTDSEKYPTAEPEPASTGEAQAPAEEIKEVEPGVQELVLDAPEAPELSAEENAG